MLNCVWFGAGTSAQASPCVFQNLNFIKLYYYGYMVKVCLIFLFKQWLCIHLKNTIPDKRSPQKQQKYFGKNLKSFLKCDFCVWNKLLGKLRSHFFKLEKYYTCCAICGWLYVSKSITEHSRRTWITLRCRYQSNFITKCSRWTLVLSSDFVPRGQ